MAHNQDFKTGDLVMLVSSHKTRLHDVPVYPPRSGKISNRTEMIMHIAAGTLGVVMQYLPEADSFFTMCEVMIDGEFHCVSIDNLKVMKSEMKKHA